MGNTVTKELGGTTLHASHPASEGNSHVSRKLGSDTLQWRISGKDLSSSTNGHSNTSSSKCKRSSKSHRKNTEGYEMITDPSETVDGGFLFPQGVYNGPQDFKVSVVRELIIRRKMAPFYKGVDGVDPLCSDKELLAALNINIPSDSETLIDCITDNESVVIEHNTVAKNIILNTKCISSKSNSSDPAIDNDNESDPAADGDTDSGSGAESSNTVNSVSSAALDPEQQIWLYRNTSECPICFLEYPRLNNTNCCGYDICTECFVQIKRNPPHPPHANSDHCAADVLELNSEPAACPFCCHTDFGVVFEAPPFEWGIPSTIDPLPNCKDVKSIVDEAADPHAPFVIKVDTIRPDWGDKLASARRRLARKSAAAKALHRSALIPNAEAGQSPTQSPKKTRSRKKSVDSALSSPFLGFSKSSKQVSQSVPSSSPLSSSPPPQGTTSLSNLLEATRTMSGPQVRTLEKLMLEEALKASMAQK